MSAGTDEEARFGAWNVVPDDLWDQWITEWLESMTGAVS